MDLTKNFKVQADNLIAYMASIGIEMTKAQALEAVARQHGVRNWDTMSGKLKAVRNPVLADVQARFIPTYALAQFEPGAEAVYLEIDRASWDFDLIQVLHDPVKLNAYLSSYPMETSDPNYVVAFMADTDDETVIFTAAQLEGIRYEGNGYWKMTNGWQLQFDANEVFKPEKQLSFEVPAVKPAKKGSSASAVPNEAVELLRIWQTWLGSDRDSCDATGKKLWDRIEAVIKAEPGAMTSEELQLFVKTIDDFEACNETDTDTEVLMGWAKKGLLECTRFMLTDSGKDVYKKAAPEFSDFQ